MRKRVMTVVLVLLGAFAVADLLAAVYATRGSSSVGNRILFQARVDGAYQLFTIAPGGGHLRQITHLRVRGSRIPGVEYPAWSPDGKQIIFDSDYRGVKQNVVSLFTVAPDGSNLRRVRLATGTRIEAGAFSPSGRLISFDWDADVSQGIDVARADGSRVRELTVSTDPGVLDGHAAWSPKGTWIAFTELRGAGGGAIVKLRLDGSGRTQLTAWALDANNAAWSPNGRRIAFNSHNTAVAGTSSNIYVVRSNGHGLRQLTHYQGGRLNAYMGGWSPDGKEIVFHLRGPSPTGRGMNQLFVMDADGSNVRQLTSLPPGSNPGYASWSPAS